MPAGLAIAEPVTIFAAASLKTALDLVASDWQANGEVVISYGGSAALAKQIIAGAPADIFISAAPEWMDKVDLAGGIATTSRRDLWGNALVVIGAAGTAPLDLRAPNALHAALGAGRLAMGQTTSVPAGQYGRASLTALGLWDGVKDQLAETENVRAALDLVALGEAPVGIVYATDAQSDARVSVIAHLPSGSHPAIRYPAALTKTAVPAAAAFLDYLSSPAASARFAAQGFVILPHQNE